MEKAAAVDLWSQMLVRAKSNDWASFVDQEEEVINGEWSPSNVTQAFLDAGWSSDGALRLQERARQFAELAPVTSEGVNRNSEAMLERLIKPLMSGLSLQDKLRAQSAHFVVEPKAGPLVSTINVPLTEEVIIAMGTHFTRYCGLIARAYTRTCNLNPFATGTASNVQTLRHALRKNPRLLFYWWRIFVSYALTGTHALTEFRPSTPHEVLQVEQMAFAMETFGLGHELGHHCLAHGRQLKNARDAKTEEFEADMFAAQLCESIEGSKEQWEVQGHKIFNPYLWTGAGGILLLGSIEIFRKVKDKIFRNQRFDTHPLFDERADKIAYRNILHVSSFETRLDFCNSARNVLKCVLLELDAIMNIPSLRVLFSELPEDWEVMQEGRSRTIA